MVDAESRELQSRNRARPEQLGDQPLVDGGRGCELLRPSRRDAGGFDETRSDA